jgi:hypothetical protein
MICTHIGIGCGLWASLGRGCVQNYNHMLKRLSEVVGLAFHAIKDDDYNNNYIYLYIYSKTIIIIDCLDFRTPTCPALSLEVG